jgi:1-acyl-sn-glycerol-3-phosphate acyltransferase
VKKLIEYIVSFLAWISGLLVFTIGAIFLLIIGIFHTGPFFEVSLKFLCRMVLLSAGIRLKVSGRENVEHGKQYVIMMNHVNMFDPFLFYAKYPGKARGVEEESHFHWPLYGRVIRRIGQFPINRKSGRKALETLKKAIELIRTRKEFSMVVLPEGTRTMTGKLGNFKKGGFLLALEAGLDILPLIQRGSFRFKQKGNWLLRPGKVELIIEKAISTAGYTKETVGDLIQRTRDLYLQYVE